MPKPPAAPNHSGSPRASNGLAKLSSIKRSLKLQSKVVRQAKRKKMSRLRRVSTRIINVKKYSNSDLNFVGLVKAYKRKDKKAASPAMAVLANYLLLQFECVESVEHFLTEIKIQVEERKAEVLSHITEQEKSASKELNFTEYEELKQHSFFWPTMIVSAPEYGPRPASVPVMETVRNLCGNIESMWPGYDFAASTNSFILDKQRWADLSSEVQLWQTAYEAGEVEEAAQILSSRIRPKVKATQWFGSYESKVKTEINQVYHRLIVSHSILPLLPLSCPNRLTCISSPHIRSVSCYRSCCALSKTVGSAHRA
jgi:hypothetical protein